MKRIFHVLVAVVTCFCILMTTTLSAYATTHEPISMLDVDGNVVEVIPFDQFDASEYLISYEDYLDFKSNVNIYSDVAVANYAWSSEYAEAGLYCTPEMFVLGLAICFIVGSAEEFVTSLRDDSIAVYYYFVEDVFGQLSTDSILHLEVAFEAFTNNEPIPIPYSLSVDVANAINGLTLRDDAGNIIDPSLSISTDYISGVFVNTYPDSAAFRDVDAEGMRTSDRMFYLTPRTKDDPFQSVTNGTFTWSATYAYNAPGYSTITNDLTGTSLTLDLRTFYSASFNQTQMLSNFYQVTDDLGCTFWICYFGYNYTDGGSLGSKVFAPSNITTDRPITINNSGTIVDGKTIVGVTWDPTSNLWQYLFGDGTETYYPLDPLGLLLSNTGAGILTNPGVTVEPNDDDKIETLPHIPTVPWFKNPGITIPANNTALDDVNTDVSDITITEAESIELGSSDAIKGFVGNIVNFFEGIFDWLPDSFRNSLNGVLGTLQTVMLLMVVVKIIDIIWP